jgi:hypothetical protein
MIRVLMILVVLSPLGAVAWHFGPGQSQLALDRAGELVSRADAALENEIWQEAVALFDQAMDALPEDESPSVTRRKQQILLAQAKAKVQSGQILEGEEQLAALLEELAPGSDAEMLEAVRHELGTTGYYIAWLMRLEGATAEEWMPEAERARQHFRLLAEQADVSDDEPTAFHKNLEAVIRLEQMDLSELKAKPLPKKCPNPSQCRNLSQRKREQCQSRCQSPGEKEGEKKQPDDARKNIAEETEAGLNQRVGTGS